MRKKACLSFVFVTAICWSTAASTATMQTASRPPLSTPTPTPSPAASAMPSPTPVPIQTLEGLQSKIRQRMSVNDVRHGRVGIKIVSLNTGKVVFENDADKYFMPASNMKNFTVAAALEKLGPDFRFVTSVYANAKPDASGTVKGDLRIYGRGDISISTAFNNGDYFKGLDNLVDKIYAAGVRRADGDLVGDESYFKGFAIPLTWEWDELQWYDGAEISALPINNNAVDLSVMPGKTNGSPCSVTVLPSTSLMTVANECSTTNANHPRMLKVLKPLSLNTLEVSGSMPLGDKGFTGYVAFTHPAEMFMDLLRQRLQLKGIVVVGKTRLSPPNFTWVSAPVEITSLESPPFREVAAKTMKPSQNMFTETILWTLGEKAGRLSSAFAAEESSVLGLGVVRKFVSEIGIPADAVIQYDGSGLSRHDLVTPNAVVTLYAYMAKQSRNAQVWRDSLTIGGIDGTLRNRFKGTVAESNIRGKTGTLDQVSALSGYVTTAAGEQLVVSIIVNNVPDPVRTRTSLIDDIVVALAGFNGRID
jgi:D-alanyl-D-alanine carboxypeptidase/D-alanyl-D-alanine-endopeptidase (penicillin-binding protein 4)